MKKLKSLLLFVLIFLIAPIAIGKQIPIGFLWTPNLEPNMKQYVLYNRVDGQAYNYDIPMKIIPCTTLDGVCMTPEITSEKECTFSISLEVPDGQSVKNLFVLRAEDTFENESGDSNEVFAIIDLTPLVDINNFTGVFNKVANTIDFVWTQEQPDRITYWELYMSEASGGPYNKIKTIESDGSSTSISSSIPESMVASGKEYFFTVVAFAKYEIFSKNSNEVLIDRKAPAEIKLIIILE